MPDSNLPDNAEGLSLPSNPVTRAERFMQLLIRHEPQLYTLILAMLGNRADADDAMQETTTVLWRKFDDFQPGSNFAAWAMTTARFQAMSFRRNRAIHRVRLSDRAVETIADHVINQADRPDIRSEALRRCLAKLNDRDRQLIELRYEQGAAAQSMAEKVSRSVDAVYQALSRIHGSLTRCVRQQLAREGYR